MTTRIIFTIATILLLATSLFAQESPLSPDMKRAISDWRTNTLASLDAAQYWTDLKALGEKVGEAQAIRIEESTAKDTDSAIALMAYKVWSQPEKVDEIAAWYGRTVDKIDEEQWNSARERLAARGLSEIDIRRALIRGWSSQMRSSPPTMRLIQVIHGSEDYLHTWEAWMLSPHSTERRTMRQRMNEALASIGDERTIAILVEKCRVLPTHGFRSANATQRQNATRAEASEIRRTIRTIGGKAAVFGLLECADIAESDGYGGEGPNSARNSVVMLLSSSYNPRQLREMPEWADSLRDPENPSQLVPWDDKWKEFKPIIEAILKDPKDLRAEDIQLLEDALAAMPKE